MVYCFLAKGFEEIEAVVPIDTLRRAGINVVTVGVGGKVIEGAHGITITADIEDSQINLTDELEMVLLPGGMPGTLNLKASESVKEALSFCESNNKYIAAICAAPIILGERSLLKGKRATCYTGFEEKLIGAIVTGEPVCVDDKIITARGAGVALEFAFALVTALVSKEKSSEIKESMLCE